MVDENQMFVLMEKIHRILRQDEELHMLAVKYNRADSQALLVHLTPDEGLGLKRALDVAADEWWHSTLTEDDENERGQI